MYWSTIDIGQAEKEGLFPPSEEIDAKAVLLNCLADRSQRLYQYTVIDEFTCLRFLGAYPEQSTYSSANFLEKAVAWFKHRGVVIECVQTDNGSEFTNRFTTTKDKPTLFEQTAAWLGIRHKLIRPYTPRHNGKVERSHWEDQKRFLQHPPILLPRRFW